GWVVVQAPEHVIENRQLEEKSSRSGKKFVKRKPPDRNFVAWDKNTFQRLIAAPPERLTSRFQVTHGMLLNVLSRPGDGCGTMRELIRRCHETPKAKKQHYRRAWQLFRSLLNRKIIEFVPPDADHTYLRVNVELQDDFSMDQVLSLYLLETLPLLDPNAPDYTLDLVTLVESILEDPDIILRRQLDKLKGQRVAEMKAEGIEYQERMDQLDQLEYPKPKREFIYSTFNAFADRHPWVGQENIRPKSIAREMFESFRSFADYIRDYELHRSEGLLLRHLSGVHKVLTQTVPDNVKTDPVRELELYLGTMIRQVDSSLLDEWERLRNPRYQRTPSPSAPPTPQPEAPPDVTQDLRTFTAAIRNRIFMFLRALVINDPEAALALLDTPARPDGSTWTPDSLRADFEAYLSAHQRLCLDPNARNSRHTYVIQDQPPISWRVQQMLIDPQESNDWVAEFQIDLAKSRQTSDPALLLLRLGSLAS
ncbi:MAG: DUF3516 domain-containing protein, partial [Verrucomicrobia bacterium]|nr:DUF3516 domain-containing protein [Verrucomicrobiota bacterium]